MQKVKKYLHCSIKSVTFASGQAGVEENWATVYKEINNGTIRIERNGNTPSQRFNLRYDVIIEIHETASSISAVAETREFLLDWAWNPNT